MFLQNCTELVVNKQTQHDISYQFKISLWQLHRHSYEEMVVIIKLTTIITHFH